MEKLNAGNLRLKVAENLKRYRKEKGITQIELAYIAKTCISTISSIETAKCDSSIIKLSQIAEALGIELYELFK